MKMKKWQQYAFFAIICFFLFFIHIGADEVDTQEAYNWVAAREIVENNQWLVPTMKEEIRIVKPPVPTWITSAVILIAGKYNNYAFMRIPSAFMAIIMIIATWGFMKSYSKDDDLSFLTAIILATNVLTIVLGRRNSPDIYANAFMMAGIWALFYGLEEKEKKNWVFMSKWMVSFYVLLLPFIVAYFYEFGFENIRKKKAGLLLCLLVFVVTSGLWPAYILLKFPELSKISTNNEIFDLKNEHVRPFYFYLSFPMFAGIWISFLLSYFIKPFSLNKVGSVKKYYFQIIWLLAGLILLMIIPEKKDRYLIPLTAPMSIMAAYMVKSLVLSFKEKRQTVGDILLFAIHEIVLILLPVLTILLFSFNKYLTLLAIPFSIIIIISICCIGVVIYLKYKKARSGIIIFSNILVCIFIMLFWPAISKSDHKFKEARSVQELLNHEEVRGEILYYVDPIHITAIWDLGEMAKIRKIKDLSIMPRKRNVILFPNEDSFKKCAELNKDFNFKIIDEFHYTPRDKRLKLIAAIVTIIY
jgi:hypothetical protein